MPIAPGTTPVPPPVFMPQATSVPTPSPLPHRPKEAQKPITSEPATSLKKDVFALPTLRLEVRDLNHDGSQAFLSSVVASKALAQAVQNVLRLLYASPKSPTTTVPPTRSVTLILRGMGGVAYTTGSELDSDHKEIHFSLDYINGIATERKQHEIMGVLTHEMVHCYQYNAFGTCPGGLIEGIADWVRLNSDLSPPHWKKVTSGKWDQGYQNTGYFLQYLEERFGPGLVQRANEKLRITRYHEKGFWTELCGRPVEQLWGDYGEAMKTEQNTKEEEEGILVEKEDAAPSVESAAAKKAGPSTTSKE
ncbi:hypothetical protein BP6252_04327 [Coleophoma cylindrospora]|uniref:BSP-domain-containing protein n=1 Tax=Coleophoma cylindrospora TaxID=1849047 RepID=A0A3D8S069_9HELO|nr:hypothetical protein BP6252_04327 [Coleophoma cylindrospora]